MAVTWWIPGRLAVTSRLPDEMVSRPILVLARSQLAGCFVLDAGPDLGRHRVGHLLLQMGHQADRAGHHGDASADSPRDAHVARDGRDGAGGVDREVAAVGGRRGLAHPLHQLHVPPGEAVLRRHLEQARGPGVDRLVGRVAQAGDDLAAAVSRHDLLRGVLDVDAAAWLAQRLLEHPGGLLDRPAEPVAEPEQAGRNGRLQRFRGAEVRQTGRDRAGSHAVLDERHGQRVEHDGLLRRGQPAHQLEVGEVAQRNLADQLVRQVAAPDFDAVRRAAAQPGLEPLLHRLTVSLVLYPESPKSASETSVTLPRNKSLPWIASSISAISFGSLSWPACTSTSMGTGGSMLVSGPGRTTRARPVTRGRKSPTIDRIAAGYTLTPRTMNMSSRRPRTRIRKLVRSHSHEVPSMRTMSPPRKRTTGMASRVRVV